LILGDSYTWNGGSHQPGLVTFSFATAAGGPNASTAPGVAWAPFNAAQQDAARQALDAWASVSGVRLVEVPDTARGAGIDLRFQLTTLDEDTAGSTYYPRSNSSQAGDVSVSLNHYADDPLQPGTYGFLVLLHEIGHGLGLKHPFDGYPTLPEPINNFDTTVMAYPKPGFATPASLRAADVEAIQYLYGSQQDEDRFSVRWAWDANLGGIRHEGNGTAQSINGTALRDIMLGQGGNDALDGNDGDDALYGGDGDDRLFSGSGNDVLYGENGNDLMSGDGGNDTLFGGAGNDTIYGQTGNDVLYGEAGDDILSGNDGDDLLAGGAGNDVLNGQGGQNRLYGHEGNDELNGGTGNDLLNAGGGANRVYGNAGTDTLATDLFRQEMVLTRINWGYQSEYNHKSYSGTLVGGGESTAGYDLEVISFADGRLVFDVNDPAAQVMRLYQAALGRQPDAVGREDWTDRLMHGAGLSSLAEGFLASEEFLSRFGRPDDSGFITRAYQQALGRDPDASGMGFWQAKLAGGMGRAEMLVGFSESNENRVRTEGLLAQGLWDVDNQMADIARLYQAVLGRAPDAGGLRFWDAKADEGFTMPQIANLFAQSNEFTARFPGATDAGFVQMVYQNTLGRPGEAAGEAFWLDKLAHGMTRGELVGGFADSTEFLLQTAHLTDHGITFA
jgi:serralysin